VRDVAYEQLPYRRRQALHLKAAETIESIARKDISAVSGLLSLHFSLGQDHVKAWEYACAAGDRALETYANVEAEAHYIRALDAARRLATVDENKRAELLTKLGDARERASMFSGALDAYRRACSHVRDDPVRIADLQLKRARARERSGAFSMALRELGTGMRRLNGIDTQEAQLCHARIAAFAAMVRWGQERSRDALHLAEQAIREARAVGAREALAQALMVADVADLALQGSVSGTRLREALAIFEDLGDLPRVGQALGNLGFVAAHGGRWPEAVECFAASRDVFAKSGDAVGTALVDLNLGEAFMKQHRTDEAAASLEASARVLRSVGFVDGAAYAELQLARCWSEFERYDDAEALLRKVASEFSELGQYASALEAAIALADVRVRVGDPASVPQLLDRAERAAGREALQFAAGVALVRAKALLAQREFTAAEEHIERGLADARARILPHEEAMLLLLADEVRKQTGRADESLRERAEEILAGLGVRR
jgi:tetratricopeptide (TPR) repeat protein